MWARLYLLLACHQVAVLGLALKSAAAAEADDAYLERQLDSTLSSYRDQISNSLRQHMSLNADVYKEMAEGYKFEDRQDAKMWLEEAEQVRQRNGISAESKLGICIKYYPLLWRVMCPKVLKDNARNDKAHKDEDGE